MVHKLVYQCFLLARRICETVENLSSYVQQLAWNILAETDKETTEQEFNMGVEALMTQCSGLFQEQLQGLTSYQINFIRAICNGVHSDFGSKAVLEEYNLGSKSTSVRLTFFRALIKYLIINEIQ